MGQSIRDVPRPARKKLGRDVYSSGQAAALLGVCSRTVSIRIDRGDLPGYRIPGSLDRRVDHDALVKYARDNGIPLIFPPVAGRVRCLVDDPAADVVSAFRLGSILERGKVAAVLVGCAEGLPAAVALAREVRAVAPETRLTLQLNEDRPASDVPPGVFDEVRS